MTSHAEPLYTTFKNAFVFTNFHPPLSGWYTLDRVRNSEYESTAMNDFMRSVKRSTQVLIVGVHRIDWSCKFAVSDVMKNFRFRSNFGRETFQGSHVSLSCS